jgi:hypothetical protein
LTRSTLLAGIALIFLAGCGSGSDEPYLAAGSGLCDAAMKVETGDAAGAETVFYDTVHQPLHDLAAEVSEVDRAAAARLLEAKEAVESDLDTDPPEADADAWQTLVAATEEALVVIGHDRLSCATAGTG